MAEAYTFDAAGVQRLVASTRKVEAQAQRPYVPYGQVPNWQFVRVTADEGCDDSYSADGDEYSADNAGRRYYPAVVEMWDATNQTNIDLGAVWLTERHDYPLVVGNSYQAQESGPRTVCGVMRAVFVTAIGVAGLEQTAADDYADYYDGSPDSADPGDVCQDSGESTPGGGITIPFNACDDAGNPCVKELVIRSGGMLAWCIRDPNNCG